MAFLTHAMQANQVWTFLGRYTPETLFILAHPPELRSPVLLPAKGLGRMPEHHGKSMQRRLPARKDNTAYSTTVNGMGRVYDIQRAQLQCLVGSTSAIWTERDAPKIALQELKQGKQIPRLRLERKETTARLQKGERPPSVPGGSGPPSFKGKTDSSSP